MLKRLAARIALAGLVLGLAGCNTVEGVGKDVQAGGKAIERAADAVQKKM
jgi:predicted small secreted protein